MIRVMLKGGYKNETKFGQDGQDFKVCAGVLVAGTMGSAIPD